MKFGLEQLVDFDHISDEDLNGTVENLVSFPSAAQKTLKGDLTLSPPSTVLPDYRGHFLISFGCDTPNLIHTLLSYLYAGSSWQHKKNPSTRHSRTPSPLNLIQNAILFVMSPFQFIDC